jgi:hypothetical protein
VTTSAVAIEHKRGDTFEHVLVLAPVVAEGEMAGFEPTSQIRTSRGELIADLECSWVDDPARTLVRIFLEDTSQWSPGYNHEMDVQFFRSSDGYTRSTQTILVRVVKDITQPDPP